MNKKNIITLVVAVIVIGVSIYFMYSLLSPRPTNTDTTSQSNQDNKQTVPSELDEVTYKSISTLSDYGKPDLTGVGKTDLFAGY